MQRKAMKVYILSSYNCFLTKGVFPMALSLHNSNFHVNHILEESIANATTTVLIPSPSLRI